MPRHCRPRLKTVFLHVLLIAAITLAVRQTGVAQPKKIDDRHAALGPWPADVVGFVPPEPGEHPRLLFRKAELAAIRKKAQTPEGRAIVKRLRQQLNGSDGETMPKVTA